jgi:hypothetical protein
VVPNRLEPDCLDPYAGELTMLITFVVTTILLLAILVTTVMHLPLWLKRVIYYVPTWLQAAVIHFVYGSWIGGILGHVVGGLLSVPWFFIVILILRPRIRREMVEAWEQNPVRRLAIRIYRQA